MKKIIKKFWGVAFILVLLSTLLVGAIPQAAAGNFALSDSFFTPGNFFVPTTVTAPALGFGILDVAQSGATIYATGNATGGFEYLYKSTDGGATWVQIATPAAPLANTHGLPSGNGVNWDLVAVAPDDPNIVAVANTQPSFADVVYLSMNGGITFTALPATNMDINAIDISFPLVFRYIAIGGNTIRPAAGSGGGALLHWNIGAVAPAWAVPTNFANLGVDDVEEVEYSSQFMADQCLLILTETQGTSADPDINGAIGLHVFRYDLLDWDQNVDTSFPRYLETTTGLEMECGHASMVLDGNFYVGDISSQIAFIAANITGNVTAVGTQLGGIYRVYGSPTIVAGNSTVTQIDTGGVPYNTVAWDGTNLMASQLGQMPTGLVVQRSSAPLAPFVTFLPNTGVKTPGTGNATIVLFNLSSGNGLAFSQGNGSAICRTTDYGKSFNGYALVNTRLAQLGTFGNFTDMWTSPDGATKYFMVDDTVDINVWRQVGFTWERVFIRAAATGQNWTVSADDDNPTSLFIGLVGGTSMYKSTDGGDTNWDVRTSSFNISDVAVQDSNTVYVAVQGQPWILKGTGPFTIWTLMVVPFTAGGGNSYSLELLADDQLIVGGTAGGVAYTTDGGTTWTSMLNVTAGNVVTAASGLATGDSIYAVSNGGGTVSRWTLGTNLFAWTPGLAIFAGGPKGIALTNGVLYVLDNRALRLHRMLRPAVDITVATGNQTQQVLGGYVQGINTLHAQAVGTTSTLWAIDNAVFDPVDNDVDYLTSPSTVPTLVYPLDGTMIPVNSLNGAVSTFIFKWTSPPVVIVPVQAYSYNIEVYLDSAGLVPVAGSPIVAVPAVASTLPDQSYSSAAGAAPVTGAGGIAVPGETYYWRVRVDMGAPVESYWTEMESFTIEQLVAIVPVIASPVNGGEVNTTTPGFSWSPISGATSYRFELATDSEFTNVVVSLDPNTAGVQLTVELERGMQYFWRVKTLTPTEGEWSTVANFVVAELPPETSPPVTITTTTAPQATITATIEQPQATTTVITIPPAEEKVVNPSYIWAIIVVGAVLVIAVIILIVRTRRTV